MSKISIVMPVYNGGAHLADALASVIRQDLGDWELVVVDDGSTDASGATVAAVGDGRVRYVYQHRRGPSAARNLGVARSSGHYLCFLDADDLYGAGKLRAHAEHLDANAAVGLSYGSHVEIDPGGRCLQLVAAPPAVGLPALATGWPFDVEDFMLRREWFERAGGFDERVVVNEDRDLLLRLALARCPFEPVAGCLTYRRVSGRMLPEPRLKLATALRVLRRAFEDPRCPEDGRAVRRPAYSALYLTWALEEFRQGAVDEARRHLVSAVSLEPELLDDGARRLLLSFVAASIRQPDDHRPRLRSIFANLPPDLAWLRDRETWAVGAGCLRRGTRSIFFGRPAEGLGDFRQASDLGIEPDQRYCREAAAGLLDLEAQLGPKAARSGFLDLGRCVGRVWGRSQERRLREHYLAARAFRHYQDGRHAEVPSAVLRAFWGAPRSLGNRGLTSIAVRSLARWLIPARTAASRRGSRRACGASREG